MSSRQIKERVYQLATTNGVSLCCSAFGDSAAAPIILSHGGGQTRFAWKKTAELLAEQGYYALSYDHRGHGDSTWSDDGEYNIDRFAGDQLHLAQSLSTAAEKPILVGASLGGLTAMVVEGEIQPNSYRAIVLVDVTPTLKKEGTDAIFAFMNAHLNDGFDSLEHAADVIAEYTGRPRQQDVSGLEKNLRLRSGRWYWHWDPKIMDIQHRRQGGSERMLAAAAALRCPVFLVRGKQSDIVEKEQVETFLKLVPHAEYVDVEEAKHMVAGDKNDIFTEQLLLFIQSLEKTAVSQ